MAMQRYQVIGYDAKDGRLFELTVEAPNKAVAQMMVLAQLRRNFRAERAAGVTHRAIVNFSRAGHRSSSK
jgi:hypothetical protein